MFKLIFITGNAQKLKQAQEALVGYDIELSNQKVETPEIQDTDCRKIAEFSAKYASNELQKAVVVSDAGYYIKSLNGFPGPFIKYINQWLTPKDILNLMKDKIDRSVSSPICVAYCEPGSDPVSFTSNDEGQISFTVQGEGSTIDKLYIPDGYTKTIATLPENERLSLWNNQCWKDLANYILNKEQIPAQNLDT